ncbi:MAG: hypothetical protein H7Y88_08365 [Phycisphaerales bacterium]|nr:hypothetical protein [Phycisphaerales bacterium]
MDTTPSSAPASHLLITDTDPLAAFLASANTPCPACGYNLRGLHTPACPECSTPIQLGITVGNGARAGALRGPHNAGWRWFLLLAFGWLLAAGTMNAVRNLGYIQQAMNNTTMMQFTGGAMTTRVTGTGFISFSTTSGLTVARTLQPVAAPAAPWHQRLLSVGNHTLYSMAWATTLALGALIGLAFLGWARSRGAGERARRNLVRLALVLFALYSGTHLYWFATSYI